MAVPELDPGHRRAERPQLPAGKPVRLDHPFRQGGLSAWWPSSPSLFIAATLVIHFSTLGRSFRAVRESEIAAAAVGIDVKRVKLLAFTLSAFFAGAAGGLYTTFSTFIHPESLGFQTTILVLTMVVVGGIGSVWGAIGGAIVFGLIAELLRQVPSYQEVIYGCILMLFMMYLPRGVFSLIRSALSEQTR